MLIENKLDLTLIRQGLLHVYNFHDQAEEIEKKIDNLKYKIAANNESRVAFHASRKARAKNLINAIDTNLENLATKEKAES